MTAIKKTGARFVHWFKAFQEKTVPLTAGMSTACTMHKPGQFPSATTDVAYRS
jgi:hypothetical protein